MLFYYHIYVNELTFNSRSAEETTLLGERLAQVLLSKGFVRTIISLEGELGSGKTVLAKGLARGIQSTDPVDSPTFVFLHVHKGIIPLYHFDLYRISTPEELDELGFFEYLERTGIIVIEWGEKIKDIIEPDIQVNIIKSGENEREIHMTLREEILDENFSIE